MYNLSCTSISTQPYTAMTWSGSAWQAGANAIPSVFVNGTVRVHPADINQNVILAYTLQAGEQGYISIANSSFLTPGGSGTNYSIFVDNTQIGSTVSVNAGTTTSSNQDLGYLNAGQTVYVMVGPGGDQSSDETQIALEIVSAVPEPGTLLLGGSPRPVAGEGFGGCARLVAVGSAPRLPKRVGN